MKQQKLIKQQITFKFPTFRLVLFLAFSISVNCMAQDNIESLQLSTFDIDVTPTEGQKMAYDSVLKTWDLGLRAKGMILLGEGKPIVILAVDWIGIYDDCHDEFRCALASAVGTVPERVAVHTLHQHDAPRGVLHNGNDDFIYAVIHRLEIAAKKALADPVPITDIGIGEAEVYRVASNRRILDIHGDTVKAMRFSTCADPKIAAESVGVIDPMVSLVSFWIGDEPVAVLSFYATHPQSYYHTSIPNPDFVGIARFYRQLAVPDALHIHFNGAGGNITAGKYNDGSHVNRGILAERLADGMKRAWEDTERFPIKSQDVSWEVEKVSLPCDSVREMDKNLWWMQFDITDKQYDLQCLSLKSTRILFMPGELFVEYQLAAKKMRPDLFVTMAAYGDLGPSYIPTANAFPRGGYECERRITKLLPDVENVLLDAIRELLHVE